MGAPEAIGPWGRTERALWAASMAVGTAISAAGWWMAAGRADVAGQVSPASLCLTGALVVFGAHALWVLRGRRAIGVRSAGLFPERWRSGPDVTVTGGAGTAAADGVDRLVAGDGLVHYHRAGCRLAAGRAWPAAPRTVHERAGRRPCGACRPGPPAGEAGS